VHSEVSDSAATLTALADRGLDVDVVQRHRGPLGPLLSARRADLEARGQLAPGQQFEDVLVLRGRQVGRTSARWPIPTP
jgi:release factor glutamine methyltransferase